MVAQSVRSRLTLPAVPTLAMVAGTLVASALMFIPVVRFEAFVAATGLPVLLPAAAPPLGTTAQMLLSAFGGVVVGAIVWFVLTLLLGDSGRITAADTLRGAEDRIPVLRRADAHPDAPPRVPLKASRELGTPFLEVRARAVEPAEEEQDLPADLDQPLAAFDPESIPQTPLAPVPPTPPLTRTRAPIIAPGERLEAFELRPPVMIAPQAADEFAFHADADAEAPAPRPVPSPALQDASDYAPRPVPAPPPPIELDDVVPSSHDPDFEPAPEPVIARTLKPVPRPIHGEEPLAAPRTESTIHSLLERLERGVAQRAAAAEPTPAPQPEPEPAPQPSIHDTLAELRRLARG